MDEAISTRPVINFDFSRTTSSPSAFAASRSSQPAVVRHQAKRPRNSKWTADTSSDSDYETQNDAGLHEEITGFDAEGKAETARRNKRALMVGRRQEYVIQKQPNRDWRAESRAQNQVHGHRRGGKTRHPEEDVEAAESIGTVGWGLSVKAKKDPQADGSISSHIVEEVPMGVTPQRGPTSHEGSASDRMTADQEALDALLGVDPDTKSSTVKAIPSSEQDALERDLEHVGADSTLADYEAMPVEEFGAALLRGMGWKGADKDHRTSKIKEVKRRPNRLGLGAKQLKENEELGGWNQKRTSDNADGGMRKKARPRLDEYRRQEETRKQMRRDRGAHHRHENRRDVHKDFFRDGDSRRREDGNRLDERERNRR